MRAILPNCTISKFWNFCSRLRQCQRGFLAKSTSRISGDGFKFRFSNRHVDCSRRNALPIRIFVQALPANDPFHSVVTARTVRIPFVPVTYP
jgi:hypothetical protein